MVVEEVLETGVVDVVEVLVVVLDVVVGFVVVVAVETVGVTVVLEPPVPDEGVDVLLVELVVVLELLPPVVVVPVDVPPAVTDIIGGFNRAHKVALLKHPVYTPQSVPVKKG